MSRRCYDIPSYQLALHFGKVRSSRLSGWRRWRWYLPWMVFALTLLPSAALAIPVLDPLVAQGLLASHANSDPFPYPLIENGNYFWNPEAGGWSVTPPNDFTPLYSTPDRDDHIIIMALPVPMTFGSDLRQMVVLAATFEDLAASLAPVPEPATLLLLGTGLVWIVGRRWR